MFPASRTRHPRSGLPGLLALSLLASGLLAAACAVDDRQVETLPPAALVPNGESGVVLGDAGVGRVQGNASDGISVTTALVAPEGAPPAPLSLGQACSSTTETCAGPLRCVDGSCRQPCVATSDCASLGAGVECRVGAALDGSGVGACGYQSYCDPAHPQSPVAGATTCPAGTGCRPSESGTAICQVHSGAVGAGGACAADADCATDHFCSEHGTCQRYCLFNTDCGNDTCSQFAPPRRAGDLAVGYCAAPACDPVRPQSPREGFSTCPVGSGCVPARDGEPSTCGQRNADAAGQYAACETHADCRPGLFCGAGDLVGACHRFCVDDGDCPGERCKLFSVPSFVGADPAGFCASTCNPLDPGNAAGGFGACPPGFACIPNENGLSQCILGGPLQRYERCTGQQCASGHACGGGDFAFCRRLCLSDADCGPGRCRQGGEFAGDTPVGICVELCNPVDPQSADAPFSPCPAGFACMPGEDGLSECRLAGAAGLGDPCAAFYACAAGLYCDPTDSVCRELCFSDADCQSGSCNRRFQPAVSAIGREISGCGPR